MAEIKTSKFNKVLSAWDVLVIAFGAMIGWGWVVSTGDWIMNGGVAGAMLGFVIGGMMVFFVGLTYAELTSAMPQCGGEHVFSFRAMGPLGSFVCTWAIVLGYVSVVCFEACALPTIVTYVYPDFLQGYLYTAAGFDIYASWLAVAVLTAAVITYINIIGTKTAAMVQTALTVVIGGVGVLLVAAAAVTGTEANLEGQLFMGASAADMLKGTLAVAVVTPFYFIGFDVIPQAAEEISVPLRNIGRILILSIVLAVVFYALIIFGVGLVMSHGDIALSMASAGGLVTADAMAAAFGSSAMAKVLIVGGLCGIVTSWNSFLIGGSRAMYAMAESYMIPRVFAKLHDTYKTPVNALLLIGFLSAAAPFFGRRMLVWVVDAGNFGCCAAYCMVAVSFLILRRKAPDMARPYKVKHYRFIGAMAVLMSGFMAAMYIIPGSGAALVPQEWMMVLGWCVLGAVFGGYCKVKYGSRFASSVGVVPDGAAVPAGGTVKGPAEYAVRPLDFSFMMPVRLLFGRGHIRRTGGAAKAYGRSALLIGDETFDADGDAGRALTKSLTDAGMTYALYDRTDAPADGAMVAALMEIGAASRCDVVIAAGGSKAINCAKCAAYALATGGLRKGGTAGEALPILFVPSVMDIAQGCSDALVYTGKDGAAGEIRYPGLQPKVVIADPAYMASVLGRDGAAEGFAALVNGIDAYTGQTGQGLADAISLYGISLLAEHLVQTDEGTYREDVWDNIVLGAVVSSLVCAEEPGCLSELKQAGGLTGKDGAAVLAAVVPAVLSALWEKDLHRYGKLARTLGGTAAADCGPRLEATAQKLGLISSLSGRENKDELLRAAERCVRQWEERQHMKEQERAYTPVLDY